MHRIAASTQPSLSIGLAVYNGEQFLARALDSLLAQSFEDFELIVSDDASTDKSGELCQAYAARDHRIRYIRQHSNLGMYRNFDFLIREARAQYFMLAAQDDEWDPDWCSVLIQNMREGTTISFGHVRLVGPRNTRLQEYHFMKYSERQVRRTFQLLFQDLPWSIGSSPMYGICRRSDILSVSYGQLETLSRDSTDSLWVFAVGQMGHIATDDRVYHYKHAGYPKGRRPALTRLLLEQLLVTHQIRMLFCFVPLVAKPSLRPLVAMLIPVRYLVRLCVSNTKLVKKVTLRLLARRSVISGYSR
jgi:glycosyltransferase involved in cell wall biosynthesis